MKYTSKINAIITSPDVNLKDALKHMDKLFCKSLLVLNDQKEFIGVLSVGDIQRALLADKPLETKISEALRPNSTIVQEDLPLKEIKSLILKEKMEFLPVLDSKGKISKVHFWNDFFEQTKLPPKGAFNVPVIIMAGGFGTRLKPLTNVLPKPLIPIGETTMLEEIFSRFGNYGCDEFHISVNYKAALIKYYLSSQHLPYNIDYFEENKPLGTAGSLSLIREKLNKTFIVHNCDILIEQDYSEILDYHKEHDNEITLVSVLKSYSIPYGTIETGINGQLTAMTEKPDMTFQINSGMYILEPHLMDEIPNDDFFHITDLINKIKDRNGKVGVFPVSENSWKDIGNWDEYLANFQNK